MRARPPAFVLLAAVLAAACGGSEPSTDADGPAAPAVTTTPPLQGPVPAEEAPVVTIPDGEPPPTLQVEDLRIGTGAEAVPGATLAVQYVGVSWSTGEEFDTSWDDRQPIVFTLGEGRVIPGWEQGLAGMRVGGRREIVIPPDLAYGAAGRPPVIGPNETLVFVVDLVAAE